MLKPALILLFCSTLFSCGGGGSGDDTAQNDEWTAKKPVYSGKTENYELTATNAADVTLNVMESLDLLHIFAFGDEHLNFLLLSENNDGVLDSDVICESGSTTIKEVEKNKKIEIIYDNCVSDGSNVNGTIKVKLVSARSEKLTIIANLEMEELNSTETVKLTGYFDVTGNDSAVYNLLITDQSNEQIWFDNFSLDSNQYGNRAGINYTGDIYISDQGKLSISTSSLGNSCNQSEFCTTTMVIKSNIELTLDVQLQHQVTMTFSDQERLIPSTIPLSGDFNRLFDELNGAPTAVITTEEPTLDRNATLVLSGKSSSDPNYDFLESSWEIIAQPESSQPTMTQAVEAEFSAALPGDYTIRLTVIDIAGNSSFTDATITVLKNKPQGQVNLTQASHVIGSSVFAQVSIENDHFDGPYNYKMKYGPANMAVDTDGLVSWDGFIPDYGLPVDVNFAVYIENEHKHEVLSKTITLTSAAKVLVKNRTDSLFETLSESFVSKQNSIDHVFFGGDKISQLVVENSALIIRDKVLIDEAPTIVNRKYQAASDVNNDGIDDYWITYLDGSSKIYQVLWRDGKTDKTTEFLSFDNGSSYMTIQLEDYDLDGKAELLVRDNGEIEIYSISSKELITTFSASNVKRMCDFNNDGFADAVLTDRIIDVKNNETIYQKNYSSTFYTVDVSGDSSCKVLYVTQDKRFIIYDIATENEQVIADSTDYFDSYATLVGDFDGDSAQEIILNNYNKSYLVDNLLSNNSAEISEVARMEAVPNNLAYQQIIIADIDGDGKDEIITTTDDRREYSYQAYSLKEGTIDLSFNSIVAPIEPLHLLYWGEQDELILSSKSQRLIVHSMPDMPLEYHGIESYPDVVSVENGTPYIYLSGYDIIKQDLAGNELWAIKPVSNSFVGDLKVLDNGLLLASYDDNHNFIHPENGDILLSMPTTEGDIGQIKVVQYSTDSHLYIADNTRHIAKIDKDYNITLLNNGESIDLFNEGFPQTFAQVDDDLLPELVWYHRNSLDYKALNLTTMVELPPSSLHDGKVEFMHNITRGTLLLQCFYWDDSCQNYIVQDVNGFKVVDKLSGEIIWRSPTFGRFLTDIAFKREEEQIKSAISFKSGRVMTFENEVE